MAPEQSTTFITNSGDLSLIVGERKQRYVVCRRTLANVCKAWETMFTKFIEATAPEVESPDDDPLSIAIVLNIAHIRFHQLPKKLTLKEMHQLATVCDKYDTVHVVQPFLENWTHVWTDPRLNQHLSPGMERYLWVSWVFGYKYQFYEMGVALQKKISTNAEGQCLTEKGMVLHEDQMPPNLMENLLRIREKCIDDMLQVCYDHLNKLENRDTCTILNSAMKETCYLLTLGSFLDKFRLFEIVRNRRTGSDLHVSIDLFCAVLKTDKSPCLLEHSMSGIVNHSRCNPIKNLSAEFEEIVRKMEEPVQESHFQHFDRFSKKFPS